MKVNILMLGCFDFILARAKKPRQPWISLSLFSQPGEKRSSGKWAMCPARKTAQPELKCLLPVSKSPEEAASVPLGALRRIGDMLDQCQENMVELRRRSFVHGLVE